jgi:hypothetical protein
MMATTREKLNRLKDQEFDSKSTNLMFPSDLLSAGTDGACMTFFINTIRNGKAKMNFKGLSQPKNRLDSPYGEVPVIHNVSRGLQGSNAKSFSNTYVRSDHSITLPMPKNLNINIQSRWSSTELGAAAMGIDQITDYSKLMEGGAGGELAKQLGLNTVGSIAGKLANGAIKGRELVELGTATVANNYAETLFKNVDNRSFSWSWTLTPRSEREAESIDNMLRLFRFHMLPEFKENVGNGNAFLLYPSSFDVVFWQDGQPNPHIPRVATCALTGMDTNYTPNGGYIRMVDGSPASYIMTLNFTELSILHKGMVGEDPTNSGTTF